MPDEKCEICYQRIDPTQATVLEGDDVDTALLHADCAEASTRWWRERWLTDPAEPYSLFVDFDPGDQYDLAKWLADNRYHEVMIRLHRTWRGETPPSPSADPFIKGWESSGDPGAGNPYDAGSEDFAAWNDGREWANTFYGRPSVA